MKKIMMLISIILVVGLGSYLIYWMNKDGGTVDKPAEEIKESKVLTREAAEEIGTNLWNYAYDTFWCKNYKYGDTKIIDDVYIWFEITNFDEVKGHYTDDYEFEFAFSDLGALTWDDFFEGGKIGDLKMIDGKAYDQTQCARGGDMEYNETVLSVDSITEDTITFNATSSYCRELDIDKDEYCNESNVTEEVSKKFIIKKVNDNWKIYRFVYPN